MRDRIARARRVIELAHDPEIIALLSQMIVEAEADIEELEATAAEAHSPAQASPPIAT